MDDSIQVWAIRGTSLAVRFLHCFLLIYKQRGWNQHWLSHVQDYLDSRSVSLFVEVDIYIRADITCRQSFEEPPNDWWFFVLRELEGEIFPSSFL